MKDFVMKELIIDNHMLAYLHDVLSLREKDDSFYQSELYHILSERTLTTFILGLRKSFWSLSSFFFVLFLLQSFHRSIYGLVWLALLISIVYATLFMICKTEIKDLIYQLRLKKAVQFALDNYNYQEYVIFLDNYLSEQSSRNYFA